jgi:hypothetical protein
MADLFQCVSHGIEMEGIVLNRHDEPVSYDSQQALLPTLARCTTEEYIRIELSLSSMYVVPHIPHYCPYHSFDDNHISITIDSNPQPDIASYPVQSSSHQDVSALSWTSHKELSSRSFCVIHIHECSICFEIFKIDDIVSIC